MKFSDPSGLIVGPMNPLLLEGPALWPTGRDSAQKRKDAEAASDPFCLTTFHVVLVVQPHPCSEYSIEPQRTGFTSLDPRRFLEKQHAQRGCGSPVVPPPTTLFTRSPCSGLDNNLTV